MFTDQNLSEDNFHTMLTGWAQEFPESRDPECQQYFEAM